MVCLHSSRAKLIRVPKEAYLQIAPAEHALVHSGIDRAPQSLQRTDARPHGNARLRHAVSANDAGRAAPVTPS